MAKPQHPSNSLFYKLKQSILKFLNMDHSSAEEEIELAHEVQRNADEILTQIRTIKNDLRRTVDGKLFTYVEDLVDPLAARIQGVTKKLGDGKDEIQKLDHWINKKVRPLVESFSSKNDDKRAIEKAILKHMVEMCTKQIDTDLKIIKDDQYHKLMHVNIEESERLSLSLRVEEALAPIIQRWVELRTPPKRLNLENVNTWKREVDQYRNQYYHTAMDLIDSLVPELDQTEEIHESLLENFKLMQELERDLPQLLRDINEEALRVNDHPRLTRRLDELITKAHYLESDLKLTAELHDRLELIKNSLNYASKKLAA